MFQTGNPYGKPAAKRLDWLKALEKEKALSYKSLPDEGPADILLYIGCTASYEEDLQNVARSIVLLLEKIKADYGILKKENCCGSPARQLGEEGLFLELSEKIEKMVQKSRVDASSYGIPPLLQQFQKGISRILPKTQHSTLYRIFI